MQILWISNKLSGHVPPVRNLRHVKLEKLYVLASSRGKGIACTINDNLSSISARISDWSIRLLYLQLQIFIHLDWISRFGQKPVSSASQISGFVTLSIRMHHSKLLFFPYLSPSLFSAPTNTKRTSQKWFYFLFNLAQKCKEDYSDQLKPKCYQCSIRQFKSRVSYHWESKQLYTHRVHKLTIFLALHVWGWMKIKADAHHEIVTLFTAIHQT